MPFLKRINLPRTCTSWGREKIWEVLAANKIWDASDFIPAE